MCMRLWQSTRGSHDRLYRACALALPVVGAGRRGDQAELVQSRGDQSQAYILNKLFLRGHKKMVANFACGFPAAWTPGPRGPLASLHKCAASCKALRT